MTAREEFSRKVMVAAFERAGGRCEHTSDLSLSHASALARMLTGEPLYRCQAILRPGNCEYDHVIPWAISRDSSLGNCQCLCKAHHLLKTTTADVPTIAKTKRVAANHIGAKKPRRVSYLKRKMDGSVIDKRTGEKVGRART